jgi:predicted NUDIX family NTP pyrophosphohydrolase
MAARSAGLLPYRIRDGRLEVLIGHMGGPYWQRKDERAWSIVKGELRAGEDPLAAALREFQEETGVTIARAELIALGESRQRGGKTVTAWATESDMDAATLRSDTFEIEWPPRSGLRQRFPELDRFEWCAVEVAERRLVTGQVLLIERLQERVQSV